MSVVDGSGTPVPLSEKVGGGGEAEIFAVTGDPSLVAKIYRRPTPYRDAKLRAMITSPPRDPTLELGHTSICWPQSLVFDPSGLCAGFLMHRVELSTHVPVLKLYNPLDRQTVSIEISWRYLVRTAANIAAAVEAIHSQGHVIGDFNESNVLVSNSALVTLVDCDSMQIRNSASGGCFRCLVGKPDFTPPELQGCEFARVDRVPAHDNFGLGVLVFLLLMEGIHPFNGVWKRRGNVPVLEERIRGGFYPYAEHTEISPMPAAPPLSILPEPVRTLFHRCFKEGQSNPVERPSPPEWWAALSALESSLANCAANPRHVYASHLRNCPWCERKLLLGGVDPFPDNAADTFAVLHPPEQAGAAQTAPAPFQKSHAYYRPRWGWYRIRHVLGRAAVLLLVIALAVSAVALFRYFEVWGRIRSLATFLTPPAVTKPVLGPLIACTAIDEKGLPVGEAGSFRDDQARSSGIMAMIRYKGATPGRSVFQFRWNLAGQIYLSPPFPFERASDYLGIRLGREFPVGKHVIEFLVDGEVQQTASFTIVPSGSRSKGAKPPATATPSKDPVLVAPDLVTSTPPAATPPAVQPVPEVPPPPTAHARTPTDGPSQVQPRSFDARHKHRFGSCVGELILSPDRIEFIAVQHSFKCDRARVEIDGDGVRDCSGKSWHFVIEGEDAGRLLRRWKSGKQQ
jgi:hypothetical protein